MTGGYCTSDGLNGGWGWGWLGHCETLEVRQRAVTDYARVRENQRFLGGKTWQDWRTDPRMGWVKTNKIGLDEWLHQLTSRFKLNGHLRDLGIGKNLRYRGFYFGVKKSFHIREHTWMPFNSSEKIGRQGRSRGFVILESFGSRRASQF